MRSWLLQNIIKFGGNESYGKIPHELRVILRYTWPMPHEKILFNDVFSFMISIYAQYIYVCWIIE
jgi:hypothetical protein